jgi:hypothetical protein
MVDKPAPENQRFMPKPALPSTRSVFSFALAAEYNGTAMKKRLSSTVSGWR